MTKKKQVIIQEEGTPTEHVRLAIGTKIKAERMRRNHSTERIAKQLGLGRVALTHIENGRNNISGVHLWSLACIFGCEVADLLPPIPQGYALTKLDYAKIADEDTEAVGWAKELFADEFNKIK